MRPTTEGKRTGTRVAVLFDYQGKRVRTAPALPPPQACPELGRRACLTPDDEPSAIKQAIIRWLEAK